MDYVVRDDRFGLRRYRNSDVQPLLEAARESSADVYPWLPWCRPDFSHEDAERWVYSRERAWRDESEISFVLCELASGTFVGGVGINRIDRDHLVGNLAYWVRSSWTGRGAASAAVRLAGRYALAELGLERLEIVVIVENAASCRVAERAGAVREGVLRRKLRVHGQSHDSAMYALVRGDIEADPPGPR